MPRVSLDLENAADLALLNAEGWRVAMGVVPGEPNQGLVAEMRESPARLPDYDDSWWEQNADIQERRSVGLHLRLVPAQVHHSGHREGRGCGRGAGSGFETNVDNYGEVYLDGQIDRNLWVITGNNTPKRILVEESAVPGAEHVVAVLVGNAPLAEPVGTIFIRYAVLAVE